MKIILIFTLLFSASLRATSYAEPEPLPISAGRYMLLIFRDIDNANERLESIQAFTTRQEADGSLGIQFAEGEYAKLTQEEDHFVITKTQAAEGFHSVSTYMGSLRSKKGMIIYKGSFSVLYYAASGGRHEIRKEQGTFMIIGKIAEE